MAVGAASTGVDRRTRQAVFWSAGWLLLAVAVAAAIAATGGPAGQWTTVYLIERSLSLDNVFLFSLLLAYFVVPPELRGRTLAIGIVGALVLRAAAIAGGLAVLETVEAVVYVFGVLLLYVAYRAFRGAAEQSDPTANPAVRLVRRSSRSRLISATGGCSFAKRGASSGRRCCSSSARSWPRTSRSRSTRSRRRSP
jgi:predicted tellurium resistance membrane protein TerC